MSAPCRTTAPRPVMLLVLGPHRCGTSVTARMLECLGASHSANLLPADGDNPTGYFEDRDVYLLNEFGLLRQLGRRWDSIRPVDWSSPRTRDVFAHRNAAVAVLRRNFHGPGNLFVLKEPRIGSLLPFWLPVLEESGFDARAVCIVRSPLEMARSLQRRNALPLAHGAALYLAQWLDILQQLRGLPSAFATFEDVLGDPEGTLRTIADRLALPLPAGFPGSVDLFRRSHLRTDARSARGTGGESEATDGIPRTAVHLHRHLLSAARTGSAQAQADALAAASAAVEMLGPLLETFDRLHSELLESRRTRLSMEESQRELVRRQNLLSRELYGRQTAPGADTPGLRARKAMDAALEVRDAKIRELEHSISWRITAPLRRCAKARRRIRSALDRLSFSARVLRRHRDSGLFDPVWYARVNRLSGIARRHAFLHFAFVGLPAGKLPNALFDPDYYTSAHPDVAAEGVLPLRHYLLWGFREERDYSPFFDRGFYLRQSPELAGVATDLPGHYLRIGWMQGKNPHPFFRPDEVLGRNPSLREEGISPLEYYLHGNWTEDPCPQFSFAMSLETPAAEPGRNPRGFLRPEARTGDPPAILDRDAVLEPPASPPDVTAIAIYLPQFHAIPENDAWWGTGFTEWTNVRRGRPHYQGHYQPHIPHRDIGYYDLTDPSVLERQALAARSAGIGGFCYYYYWFAGKRLLGMPTDRMLATGRPDFPFCFCWANENWTRRWDGGDNEILIAQEHSGQSDDRFIRDLLPAFRDPRYIRIEGRPLLVVYRPALLPDAASTARHWREVCRNEGPGDIFLALMEGPGAPEPAAIGFDATIQFPPVGANVPQITSDLVFTEPALFRGMVFDYRGMAASYALRPIADDVIPGVCPSWDNTARTMERAHSWINTSPGNYHRWISKVVHDLRAKHPRGRRVLFINAWNEWAEGNHLEPDEKHGHAWLDATRRALCGDGPQPGAEPDDHTEELHPAVFRHRWERVLAVFGGGIARESHGFLVHHLPLLASLLQQGHTPAVDRGTPCLVSRGKRLALRRPAALRDLRRDLAESSRAFCFVILQFNQHHQTVRCVESLRRLDAAGAPIRIVIVDNGSRPAVAALSEEAWRDSPDVTLLHAGANLGYARGNNLGYAWARDRLGASFIAVLNNDTTVAAPDFTRACVELFHEHGYSLLGPDIVNRDGSRGNPWNDRVYDSRGWDDLISRYRCDRGTWLAGGPARFPGSAQRSPGLPLLRNGILHGAAIVASPLFVRDRGRMFDERTLLYGEEFLLSSACLLRGHTMLYSRHVRVHHEHGASTAGLPSSRKWQLGYDNAILAAELSRDRLARHEDAVAGRPIAPDAPELPGLLADGGRHVLIDLLFCQPGFHGGGEYGKAVFKACAEAAARAGDVQIWAALNPDLEIEEWVWQLCRRFAINVVAVRSFGEIAALVNGDRFDSFFAPAIAVYTGYEYLRKVGDALPFTCRRTKVLGTLLDIRDYEMARDWRAIADARRRAGCTSEGRTPADVEAEEQRQARLASDLLEMYRGICNHQSVTKILTISDYCRYSILRHIDMPEENLEVVHAPQKSRPAPLGLPHPEIDFERTPFALLLNAARIEKNAASAVAAFDALFSSHDFAETHPELMVVLTGLQSFEESGIPTPRHAGRFILLQQLEPGHLEFLLQQARMLLYPSFNEGFGYPPLEAMTHGTPSVVSRCTSLPEVCGPAAVYCDPCDLDSIAAAIRKLLRDGMDARLMAEQLDKMENLRAAAGRRMVDQILCRESGAGLPCAGIDAGSSERGGVRAAPQWRETDTLPVIDLGTLASHPGREVAALLIKGTRGQRSFQRLGGGGQQTNVALDEFTYPDLFVVRVRNVTVKGADVVLMDGNPSFWDGIHPAYAQRMFPRENAGVTGRDAESVVRVSSPVAHLGHWTSHIYGHFLLEMLPKVVAFLDLKSARPDLKLLASNWAGDKTLDILRAFVQAEDLCTYDAKTQQVEAADLILLPDLFRGRVFHPAMDRFLAMVRAKAAPPPQTARRLFVSKARWRLTHGDDFRFLANEDEIRGLLEDRGFLTVFPEELPWPAQVSLFAGAEVIVGEYTSALHNALFSPAGAAVIGLNHINEVQERIASYAGHRIGCILPEDGHPRVPGATGLDPGYRIRVDDLDRLLRAGGLDE